jgi:adenylate kinase
MLAENTRILDKALSDLDREAKRGYTESLRTLMERLRYAASTLP